MTVVKPNAFAKLKHDDGIVFGHWEAFRHLSEDLHFDVRCDLRRIVNVLLIGKMLRVAIADHRDESGKKILIDAP